MSSPVVIMRFCRTWRFRWKTEGFSSPEIASLLSSFGSPFGSAKCSCKVPATDKNDERKSQSSGCEDLEIFTLSECVHQDHGTVQSLVLAHMDSLENGHFEFR